MVPKISVSVLIMVAMFVGMEAVEMKQEDKKAKYAGGKNPHKHHLDFLGSMALEEEFDELSEEDAADRLLMLATKIDRNGDGKVDKDELEHWIIQSLKLLDKEQAYKELHDIDENKDKKVEWKEILDHYNMTAEQYKALRNKRQRTEEEEKHVQDILEDETKFNLADLNKDKALDLEEYIAFHNPEMEDYKHMHQFLVDDDMKDYDKNKDGKLSLEEFHYYEAGPDSWSLYTDDVGFDDEKDDNEIRKRTPEEKEDDIRKFRLYDLNKDGFLDKAEFRPLTLHDYKEDAEDEVEYLIGKADDNNDGVLSMNEIREHAGDFVGHTATGGDESKFLHFVKHDASRDDEL